MKTSQLTVADNIAGDDLLQIVDVNDPTMNIATGTNKRITATLASNQLFNLVDANSVVTKISTATNTFSGDRLADTSVSGSKLASETITNSNIAGAAAIALSKLATGTLPVDIKIVSNNITDGTIVNADISANAAIALTKLADGFLPTGITINSSNIVNGSIADEDISANAAIALTKLANGVLPSGITLDPANAPVVSPNFGIQILTSGGLTALRDTNVILSANRHDATTEGPELNLIKTRGTIAAPVIVSSADELGDIAFAGYNGLNNQRAASIRAFADGAPSSSSIFPGVRIDKVGTETGTLGGTTTITTVNSPSQITISSTAANIAGPVTFRTLYSGTITVLTSTTATITGLATTAGLFVDQVLRRDGGDGAFGNTATIDSVDSSSQITISSTTANTAGAIVFDYIATGTISASTASTTITNINSTTAGFYPGQKLRKIGTSAGAFGGITTVVSVDSPSQITISSTAANTLGSLTFACGWSGNISGISNSTTITGITSGFSVAGRLTFNTTSPGNIGVTERMRITSAGNVGIGTVTPTAKLNVVDNSSSDALRITQTGSGNALVVEDSTTPDTTPFVIDSDGKVITSSSLELYSNDGTTTSSNAFAIHKSRGTKSAPILPSSGDAIFSLSGKAYNGATYEDATAIQFAIDGTIGQLATSIINGTSYRILTVGNTDYTLVGAPTGFTVGTVFTATAAGSAVTGTTGTVYRTLGDMPGRIIFNTGSDGGPLAERMRIASNGRVGIGTTSPSAMLHVTQSSTATTAVPALQITHLGTGTGNAVVIEDEAATDSTPFVISNAGDVGIGTSTPSSKLHVVGNLTMASATTATSATAGSASALPALPLGYLQITLNGTVVNIPYYAA